MDRAQTDLTDRLLGPLPGWVLVGAGLLLLGLALIVPAWQTYHQMQWNRALMQVQADRLADQQARYERFHEALQNDEPRLLERLAYTQLGLTPAGRPPLMRQAQGDMAGRIHWPLAEEPASVDRWLAQPMPQIGVDIPLHQPADTRLTRLARGPTRPFLLLAALLCLAGGIFWPASHAPTRPA